MVKCGINSSFGGGGDSTMNLTTAFPEGGIESNFISALSSHLPYTKYKRRREGGYVLMYGSQSRGDTLSTDI